MTSPFFPIDDASYQEGRTAFASGASVRDIVVQGLAAERDGSFDDRKFVSGALGFVDALLDHLRGKAA